MLPSAQSFRSNKYHTAIVYSDPDSIYTDELIRIINSESEIPTKICTYKDGALQPAAHQYNSQLDLNIFAVNHPDELSQFKLIQHSLLYSDHRLVLVMSSEGTDQQLLDNIRWHLSHFKMFVFFRPNCELWLYRYIKSETIVRYQMNLTDTKSVLKTIHSIYNWRSMDLSHWSPILFVHYTPPFSMVVPNFNGDGKYIAAELMGPDPMIAYDIAKQLNATARIVTDLDTVSIGYDWYFGDNAKESSFADYLYVVKYYDRVALDLPPLDYNWT